MVLRTIIHNVRTYFMIAFGLLVLSVAWTAFLLPHQISGSGVTGIGAIVFYATGIPMGYTYFAINVLLMIIALKSLGTSFGIKTIYGVVLSAVMLTILQPLIPAPVVQEKFMSAIIGGILCGTGLGIVFTQGGSTGGTDIIALVINKYRNISPGRIILYCDVIIISSSYLILTHLESAQRVETMVYGFVTMAIQAYTLDAILTGNRQSVQMFIFSRHFEKIADEITTRMHRGVTVIDGTGWYTKENQKVIITMIRKHEASDVYRIIKSIDNEAFIAVANVMGVYGKGFEELKK
ncbi:MAG TPA: YitT family protein [Bacteroidales bacterium]|nr:YitT family protein [Bacteroidales bacterium]HOX74224.1 YitT family protein [Bacteroidales bacterium]HPM87511.1 YitT family protein [Bacteroidales bacterium]HQM69079.1 YitT family protein [Bacteroidales bacterium]